MAVVLPGLATRGRRAVLSQVRLWGHPVYRPTGLGKRPYGLVGGRMEHFSIILKFLLPLGSAATPSPIWTQEELHMLRKTPTDAL